MSGIPLSPQKTKQTPDNWAFVGFYQKKRHSNGTVNLSIPSKFGVGKEKKCQKF